MLAMESLCQRIWTLVTFFTLFQLLSTIVQFLVPSTMDCHYCCSIFSYLLGVRLNLQISLIKWFSAFFHILVKRFKFFLWKLNYILSPVVCCGVRLVICVSLSCMYILVIMFTLCSEVVVLRERSGEQTNLTYSLKQSLSIRSLSEKLAITFFF